MFCLAMLSFNAEARVLTLSPNILTLKLFPVGLDAYWFDCKLKALDYKMLLEQQRFR